MNKLHKFVLDLTIDKTGSVPDAVLEQIIAQIIEDDPYSRAVIRKAREDDKMEFSLHSRVKVPAGAAKRILQEMEK